MSAQKDPMITDYVDGARLEILDSDSPDHVKSPGNQPKAKLEPGCSQYPTLSDGLDSAVGVEGGPPCQTRTGKGKENENEHFYSPNTDGSLSPLLSNSADHKSDTNMHRGNRTFISKEFRQEELLDNLDPIDWHNTIITPAHDARESPESIHGGSISSLAPLICPYQGCKTDSKNSPGRPKEFISKKLLRDHIRITHEPNFRCPDCPTKRPFGTRTDLQRHKLMVHDTAKVACKRPYCEIKNSNLARADKRAAHYRKYHGSFSCMFRGCTRTRIDGVDYGFETQEILDDHVLHKHRNQAGAFKYGGEASMMFSVGSMDSVTSHLTYELWERSVPTPTCNLESVLLHMLQPLVKLLLRDSNLRRVCKEALKKEALENLSYKFHECLQKFPTDLVAEADLDSNSMLSHLMVGLARRISKHHGWTAQDIHGCLVGELSLPGKLVDIHEEIDCSDSRKESKEASNVASSSDFEFYVKVISVSTAFAHLIEKLERFVHLDGVHMALSLVWPVENPKTSALRLEYKVRWEVEEFLSRHFSKGQKLRDVPALTGEGFNAQAQSCGEYMSTWWPDISVLLLDIIEEAFSTRAKVSKANDVLSVEISLEKAKTSGDLETRVQLGVSTTYKIHGEIISALAWLSSAIRCSTANELTYSTTSIVGHQSKGTSSFIELRLNALEPLPPRQACWHALLPHGVIAKGFPIKARNDGQGLEISFADMAILSRCKTFVEFDQGLILEGLRAILIPIETLARDKAIQWHFVYKEPSKTSKKNRIRELLKLETGITRRYKELSSRKLAEHRCFLGWAEEATIAFGTAKYPEDCLKISGASRGKTRRYIKSRSVSAGTPGMGVFSVSATQQHNPYPAPSSLSYSQSNEAVVGDKLIDEEKSSILVYDNSSHTAWFLPYVVVALFLVHKTIARRRYQLFRDSSPVELETLPCGGDQSSHAKQILLDSLGFTVSRRTDQNSRSRISPARTKNEPLFRDVVDQVLQTLETTMTGLESGAIEWERLGDGAKRFLHGVEFLDVIRMKKCISIREVEVEQVWAHLVQNSTAVLLCSGLGQAIVPSNLNQLCDPWRSIPPGRQLMVATVPTIRDLVVEIDGQGSCLGEYVEWVQSGDIVQTHQKGHKNAVYHTQQLRKVDGFKCDPDLLRKLSFSNKPCLVFSDITLRNPCHTILRSGTSSKGRVTSIGCLPQLPSEPTSPTLLSIQPGMDKLPMCYSDASRRGQHISYSKEQSCLHQAYYESGNRVSESQKCHGDFIQQLESAQREIAPKYSSSVTIRMQEDFAIPDGDSVLVFSTTGGVKSGASRILQDLGGNITDEQSAIPRLKRKPRTFDLRDQPRKLPRMDIKDESDESDDVVYYG